jgi:hypothetical protein
MRYVLMATLITLTWFDFSMAQVLIGQRESLGGLKEIWVVIEAINKDAAADGLSRDSIRVNVEHILRSSEISLLTDSEVLAMPSSPYLYVKVATSKHKEGFYAYDAQVELRQKVSLLQQPPQNVMATTWSGKGLVGTVYPGFMRQLLSDVVVQVQAFAKDYLAVNPH